MHSNGVKKKNLLVMTLGLIAFHLYKVPEFEFTVILYFVASSRLHLHPSNTVKVRLATSPSDA
jgi:hypothetical protein